MQTWRAVPSHFNFATPFDQNVFNAMGIIVTIVATALLILTVLAFTSMRPVPSSLAVTIRIGMLLLLVDQVLGALIIANGAPAAAMGDGAAVFGPHGVVLGEAGILKYPHGIAMHAIQVLPVLALLGLMTSWNTRRRVYTVAAASIGYILIVLISTVQAYSGRGGLTSFWLEVGALLLALLLLISGGAATLAAVNWREFQRFGFSSTAALPLRNTVVDPQRDGSKDQGNQD